MALIKQSNARDIARAAIVLDLGDLQRQATGIIEQARARAEGIIAEAQAERLRIIAGAAEQGKREGTAAGRAEGHTAGLAAGKQEALEEYRKRLGVVESAWMEALAGFEGERTKMLHLAQRDVLRLAIRIGECITRRVVRIDPGVAAAQLEAVLAATVRPTELVVRVHPEDREALDAAVPGLLRRFAQARHVELIDDAEVGRGSCIGAIRSAGDHGVGEGVVDASIRKQIERIVELLLPGETAVEEGGVVDSLETPDGGEGRADAVEGGEAG